MPLVMDPTSFRENACLQSYSPDKSIGNADFTELVSAVCSRILDNEPTLVADVASGRASRQALAALICRTANEESRRASFFIGDLQDRIMDFLFGYGPLQPYVNSEDITDIDGTGPDEFSIKADGQRSALDIAFPDAKAYDTFCRLAIIRNGGIINENDSHCRVTDERYRLRINVTVPPRSVKCASISIRKHRRNSYKLEDLQKLGMLDNRLVTILNGLACSGSSVLICGKGASGKTTLLRAFINAMPRMERVLIAESDCEIYPEKPYCLVQRIRKTNEGGRPVSLRDLVADGLTMSLDTYIIGEIVGEESMEFMRAAFSGHRCLATTHANSAQDALERLVTLARPAAHGESESLMRRMLTHGVGYLIHLQNFQVTEMLQVIPCTKSEDAYELAQIWRRTENPETDSAINQYDGTLVPGS